jgi:hypothetical protein
MNNPAEPPRAPALADTLQTGPDRPRPARRATPLFARLGALCLAIGATYMFVHGASANGNPSLLHAVPAPHPTASDTPGPDPTRSTDTLGYPPTTLDPYADITVDPGPRDLATPILLRPVLGTPRRMTATTVGPHDPYDCPDDATSSPDFAHVNCYRLGKPVLTIRRLRDLQAIPAPEPSDDANRGDDNRDSAIYGIQPYGGPTLALTLTRVDSVALADYSGNTRRSSIAVVINHNVFYALRTHPQNTDGRIMLPLDIDLTHAFMANISK